MKQSVKENIVKWVLTSLLVTIGGTATTFFGLTLLDRIPVTLSTDERFYLSELPDTFQMIEDYLGIPLDELTSYGSILVFFDEDERISQLSIPFYYFNNGTKDTYMVNYSNKQIKISLTGKSAITETGNNVKLFDVLNGIVAFADLDVSQPSYLVVVPIQIQGIAFSSLLNKNILDVDEFVPITIDQLGRFVEISLIEEQSGNTLAMYYVPVNS